jgi:4'-phosphopantetheinyl transferase
MVVLLLDQTNNEVDPKALMFKKNMYGKPEVDWQNYTNCNNPPLHFNISHTDSLIACGVTVHVPVSLLFKQMPPVFLPKLVVSCF